MGDQNQFGKKGVYFGTLCGKMQRNLSQMTPDQKQEYAKALNQLRSEIEEAAVEAAEWAIFGSWHVLSGDSSENIIKRAVTVMQEEWWLSRFRAAARQLFRDYDANAFYNALFPLEFVLAHRAYGPYWVSKCSQGPDGRYRSAVLDRTAGEGYRWSPGSGLWIRRDGHTVSCAKCLPPTTQELREEFKRGMEGFR